MTGGVFVERERQPVTGADAAASFDQYVVENQAGLVRFATLLAGSRPLAEDLVQDVLIRLFPRWGELADPHPYVRRCVMNEFFSWRRRWHTRFVHVAPDELLRQETVDPWVDGPDPELWAGLQRLPRQQRAAVVLRYYEGFDDAEIADLLGCKEGTVRAHVSRALAALRFGLGVATAHQEAPTDD